MIKNIENFALQLARAERESEVSCILEKEGVLNDDNYWKPFGRKESNIGIIENQQSSSDNALVEKLMNSTDAVLIKACYKKGISPTGPDAPKRMTDAVECFFGIPGGNLNNIDSNKCSELARNIYVLASSADTKSSRETNRTLHINITICDKGEGQTPNKMEDTFLSLNEDNKVKIPFVQGKFNMGGTGVLPFCGEYHYQLIITRKSREIENYDNDDSYDQWAVTVVRKEEARDNEKRSKYTYLTDSRGKILRFDADDLKILLKPVDQQDGNDDYESVYDGTFIKLFNYDIPEKTNIQNDFFRTMSLRIPRSVLPIRLRETRKNLYQGHSFESNLKGIEYRLHEPREKMIDVSFSDLITVQGQRINAKIYLFNNPTENEKDRVKKYKSDVGVIFSYNGQAQYIEKESFFRRCNLGYLEKQLLVILDCSELPVRCFEKLFMASRDRIRSSDLYKEIIDSIKDLLKNNQTLQDKQEQRRQDAFKETIADDKPLVKVLEKITKSSPVLSQILFGGSKITSPYRIEKTAGNSDEYIGKDPLTKFFIVGKNQKDNYILKKVPKNHSFIIKYETDAIDKYFSTERNTSFIVSSMSEGVDLGNNHLHLEKGIATLTVKMPQNVSVGQVFKFKTYIQDERLPSNFESYIDVYVEKPQETTFDSKSKKKKRTSSSKNSGNRPKEASLSLPNIQPVKKDGWGEFGMDESSVLKAIINDDSRDYFVNMDNKYLHAEIDKLTDKNKRETYITQFKYSLALIALGIECYFSSHKQDNDGQIEQEDKQDIISRTSEMVAPVLLPMLHSMVDLEINNSDSLVEE